MLCRCNENTSYTYCDQLVVGPTHARGGMLDLLMTDVPALIQVAVVAPNGNSDHSLPLGRSFRWQPMC